MNFLQRLALFLTLVVILFCVSSDSGMLNADELIHVVGKNETVYSISRFYRVTANELMRINNITDPTRLQAGRRLVIPSSAFSDVPALVPVSGSASEGSVNIPLTDYRVVRGDTLFGIARSNEISLQTLLDINRLSSSHVLKVGDTIKVPARNIPAPTLPTANSNATAKTLTGVYSLRWPIIPRDIAYMTGQMGVVVEGEYNESVKSLTQGRVISAGPWRKYGRVVIIETTGGYFYMYGGCETLSVSVGDRILPGTEVGKLGVNTVSDKPQLFFMVFRSDTPIDPALAPRAAGNV